MKEIKLEMHDDDLGRFEAEGAAPLPVTNDQGYIENEGTRLWYASYGSGAPVILLHGGLGHSGNWGYQVPALVSAGYRVILIDSRGHGRSMRDARLFPASNTGLWADLRHINPEYVSAPKTGVRLHEQSG